MFVTVNEKNGGNIVLLLYCSYLRNELSSFSHDNTDSTPDIVAKGSKPDFTPVLTTKEVEKKSRKHSKDEKKKQTMINPKTTIKEQIIPVHIFGKDFFS